MNIYKLQFAVLILFVSAVSEAAWKIEKSTDMIYDIETIKASTSDANGNIVSLSLRKNNPNEESDWVWFEFSTPRSSPFKTDVPIIYRVDRYPVNDTKEELEGLRISKSQTSIQLTPHSIRFFVWKINNRKIRPDFLADMMRGSQLVVRYTLLSGEVQDAVFDLKGADKTISSALNISTSYNYKYHDLLASMLRRKKEFDAKCRSDFLSAAEEMPVACKYIDEAENQRLMALGPQVYLNRMAEGRSPQCSSIRAATSNILTTCSDKTNRCMNEAIISEGIVKRFDECLMK